MSDMAETRLRKCLHEHTPRFKVLPSPRALKGTFTMKRDGSKTSDIGRGGWGAEVARRAVRVVLVRLGTLPFHRIGSPSSPVHPHRVDGEGKG